MGATFVLRTEWVSTKCVPEPEPHLFEACVSPLLSRSSTHGLPPRFAKVLHGPSETLHRLPIAFQGFPSVFRDFLIAAKGFQEHCGTFREFVMPHEDSDVPPQTLQKVFHAHAKSCQGRPRTHRPPKTLQGLSSACQAWSLGSKGSCVWTSLEAPHASKRLPEGPSQELPKDFPRPPDTFCSGQPAAAARARCQLGAAPSITSYRPATRAATARPRTPQGRHGMPAPWPPRNICSQWMPSDAAWHGGRNIASPRHAGQEPGARRRNFCAASSRQDRGLAQTRDRGVALRRPRCPGEDSGEGHPETHPAPRRGRGSPARRSGHPGRFLVLCRFRPLLDEEERCHAPPVWRLEEDRRACQEP